MGAWIEMLQSLKYKSTPFSSHPTMGAWIEILLTYRKMMNAVRSHPTMGAWIEIIINLNRVRVELVAPHDGCVD